MLLRKKNLDYKTRIGIGMLHLIFGWCTFVLSGAFGSVFSAELPDFLRGFLAGLSTAAWGVSIYMNVTGIILWRKQGEN
jgi:hypothetical protein